ncbi:hypothetical protein [Streptomyces sp. NPDC057301]|uniref:hypothetical protein n=1 Tax=Streptomyces sp. NPDC057301 TaxID=3346093 RepID=UPI0036357F14
MMVGTSSPKEPVAKPKQRAAPHNFERGPWELKEELLARINELEAILEVTARRAAEEPGRIEAVSNFQEKAREELDAARDALTHFGHPSRRRVAHLGVAQAHVDAALNLLVWIAPLHDVKALLPGLLTLVEEHLDAEDSRRHAVVEIASEVRRTDVLDVTQRAILAEAVSLARRIHRREILRVRSFVRIVRAVTAGLLLIAIAVAALGTQWPRMVPLCFVPESFANFAVVCPTADEHWDGKPTNDQVAAVAGPQDYLVIEIVGVVAASVAAAASLRRIRGTSLPYGVPVALALLKLPTGALTAPLGLLLMSGGFVPGLSALDSSAQIISWAAIFGYAQQLFTKFVDNQGQAILNSVGVPNGNNPKASEETGQ